VRCLHPYRAGENGKGEWSPCDAQCTHKGPIRMDGIVIEATNLTAAELLADDGEAEACLVEAQWRILTVHHLDGNKLNCRWWNLCALCQRCHLSVQGRVKMERPYFLEHSEWFKPYVAGYYAWHWLHEDLSREAVMERLDELLESAHA
jgi:hypothetical protein